MGNVSVMKVGTGKSNVPNLMSMLRLVDLRYLNLDDDHGQRGRQSYHAAY